MVDRPLVLWCIIWHRDRFYAYNAFPAACKKAASRSLPEGYIRLGLTVIRIQFKLTTVSWRIWVSIAAPVPQKSRLFLPETRRGSATRAVCWLTAYRPCVYMFDLEYNSVYADILGRCQTKHIAEQPECMPWRKQRCPRKIGQADLLRFVLFNVVLHSSHLLTETSNRVGRVFS